MKALVVNEKNPGKMSYQNVKGALEESGVHVIEVEDSVNINKQIKKPWVDADHILPKIEERINSLVPSMGVTTQRKNNMFDIYNENATTIDRQRAYFISALSGSAWNLKAEADKATGFGYDRPQNAKEAFTMIKDGKAFVDEDVQDGDYGNQWWKQIIWRDKSIEKDSEKRAKIYAKIEEAKKNAEAEIVIAEDAKSMKKIAEDFAKKTYH